jgi:hypothetical protein
VLALGVEKSFRSRGHGMVRLRYPRRGADNRSLPGHTLRRGPEGHGKAATEGRHLAGSVNHGANMPAHGSSARSASAVFREAFPHMLFVFDDLLGNGAADCEAGSDAVVLEVGVLPQVGVATLIAGQASASMTPASTSVLRSSARPYPPSRRHCRVGP